jgi:DNA-binding NtrC family response regulator
VSLTQPHGANGCRSTAKVLSTELPIRKELSQSMALAPAAMAAAAFDAGSYWLKDISRSAAREAERELILRILQQTRWSRKETAELLGISYKALLYKIKENGFDKAS